MEMLLTVNEVRATLRVSATTLWRMFKDGRLPYLKIGAGANGAVRVRQSDLDAYLAKQSRGATST